MIIRKLILSILLTSLIFNSINSIAFADIAWPEYNEDVDDNPVAVNIYFNPNSKAYKQLGQGEPLFMDVLPAGESSYKLLSHIDGITVELLTLEKFEPYNYIYVPSIPAEVKLKKDTVYEVPVSNPKVNGSITHSYALRIQRFEGSEIVDLLPYNDHFNNDEDFICVYSPFEGDADIISDGDRSLELVKVRVGGSPIDGVSVNDSSYIWASLTLALQHTVDRNHPIGGEYSFNPKGETSIPGWILRAGLRSMYPGNNGLPPTPPSVTYDDKNDIYLIDADALIRSNIIYDENEVKVLRVGPSSTVNVAGMSAEQAFEEVFSNDASNTVYIRSHKKTVKVLMRSTGGDDYGNMPFRFAIGEIEE